MEADPPPQLRRFPSVLDLGKLVAVEYDGEAGFLHQVLILRTAATAAMLNTTGRMCDSSSGLFWILTPDGDVCPELRRVPRAMGYSDDDACWSALGAGRHIQLTQADIARSVLGGQETEDACKESETPALPEPGSTAVPLPATPSRRGLSDEVSLPPDDNMTDPLLDARVLSVERNSAGDRHRGIPHRRVGAVSMSLGQVACVRSSDFLVVL